MAARITKALGRATIVVVLVAAVSAGLFAPALYGAVPASVQGQTWGAAEAAIPTAATAPTGLPQRVRFDHLSLEQGLPQSVVQCIVQDSQGFMWFGTQDGLARYDGYEFKVYKHDPEDAHSLTNNMIYALYTDRQGVLWVGTGGGLDQYDRQMERFVHYRNDPNDPRSLSNDAVQAIYEDREGTLWVGTGGGLNRLDRGTGQFDHFEHDPASRQSLSGNSVNAIYQDEGGALWVGTGLPVGGLDRLDAKSLSASGEGQFEHYSASPVQSIYQDREGLLWIGTSGDGLGKLDPQSAAGPQSVSYYRSVITDPHSLGDDWVWAAIEDPDGTLWLATHDGGVDRFDRQSGTFAHYRNDPSSPDSLSNDQTRSLYYDRAGILWVGTFGGGVDRYDRAKAKFALYRNDPNDPNSLSSSQVWSIQEEGENILWVGTFGGGLNRLDRVTGRFTRYQNDPSDPGSLSGNSVMAVQLDREGTLWIGLLDGGLDRFDRTTGTFIHYPTPGVTSITLDDDGVLWFGTPGFGLGRFVPQGASAATAASGPGTEPIHYYTHVPTDSRSLSDGSIASLYVDREGVLWVGTFYGGLNRFDRGTEQFTPYQNDPGNPQSLSNNTVVCIYQDRGGQLWVGTADGLEKLDRAAGTFQHYSERDGLPNSLIYGILEDDTELPGGGGYLWVSTNKGLSRFDPNAGTFRNYGPDDGLQGPEFNQGSCFKSSSGEMFFGGINGLNAFYPDEVRDSTYVPPIVVTDFQLFNESVAVGGDSPLQRSIVETEEIRLPYYDDFFSFEFASLHYSAPEKNQYAYIMTGLDKDWNDVGNRRFAGYTSVPPGEYTFRVKGTNSDGVWNEQGTAIRIIVTPPFWQTWWFRVVAVGLVVGGVLGGFALRVRAMDARRRQLEVQVQERTRELSETLVELKKSKEAAEAASRAKSVFLANMSHELRTPLNAILGFAQLMSRDAGLRPDQAENLGIISRSGEHLLGLVNSVLEMSKIEAGRVVLKEQSFDLHHLLDGLEEMFHLRATGKGLALAFEQDPDVPQYIRADEGKLRQVLMNLLGNAIKFTAAGGVALRVRLGGAPAGGEPTGPPACRLVFEVQDTGPGIASSDLERVFEPFAQASRGQDLVSTLQAEEGTGLGLPISRQFARLMGGDVTVSSELGKGSVFRFETQVGLVGASDVRPSRPARRVVGLQPGQPTYRLLTVDDKEVNRKLIVRILSPLGFEVREAANGQEAIEVWESWAPHLIWMDMRMPVLDGYQATRRIKATTKGQATVIVAVTASALEEDRAVILSEGCDGYIRKPLQEEELFDALSKYLGVGFVYEETRPREGGQTLPGEGPEGQLASAADRLALVQALAASPDDWVARLQQAAILGDLGLILLLLDEIREQDAALANALDDLARDFEHGQILTLIQQAEEFDERPPSSG